MIKSKVLAKTLISMVEDDGIDSDKVLEGFLRFIKSNNMTDQLSSVLEHLLLEQKRLKSENDLIIDIAHDAPANLIEKIKNYIKAPKEVNVELRVKPEIIGGFVGQYQGKVYDGSISGALNRLKRELVKN